MKQVSIMLMNCFRLILLLVPVSLFAQTDTTATDDPAVEEESSLIAPSIEFSSVQKSDNSIDLRAGLKAKVNGQFINLYKLKISFFQLVNEEEKELGFAITDNRGKVVYNVKGDSLKTDADGKLHFKAVFAGNKAMESTEEFNEFKRAKLVITPIKEDSLLSIHARLVDLGTGSETPIPEAAVGIFVKRSFLPLKVAEATTDENGEATMEIPANLPGDPKGNLTLIGRLDENETYGNLEATVVQPWGLPVSDKLQELPRSLWSTHPPIWMLVTFAVLMTVVWGHYLVIIIQLFRLRKEEPAPDSPTIDPIFK